MRYALIGSGASARPAPKRLAPVIETVAREVDAQPTSLARTQAAVDFARKRGATLSSQQELYDGYRRGLPGYNPANPPGRSTHEGRNDGVAYAHWPALFALPWWAWGQDWPLAAVRDVLAAYRRHGWLATVTYPASPSEQHHVNLRRAPVLRRPLRRGARGRAVRRLQRKLAYLVRPDQPHVPPGARGKRYLAPTRVSGEFDGRTERALKAFQRDHRLAITGSADRHTHAQLQKSIRDRKAKLAARDGSKR